MESFVKTQLKHFGYLFYIVNPNETYFEKHEDVPVYVNDVVPFFITLVLLERIVEAYKKKHVTRINDSIVSLSQGMTQEFVRILFHSAQIFFYVWTYENCRLLTLPWNSPWTWFLCFIGVDLAYYWLHRASHELNILWASHQVHHSSEDYNLTTALRQSALQSFSVFMFYLPLALAIPPSVYLVHNQFNTLYQFWIHTQFVKSIGPLEYILNTPSHHRVHHGRNRYCIDKNYAGTLIIWDRMFGTFEAESEEVVYGLTHPVSSFNPIYIQLFAYASIWTRVRETEGFMNKLSVIFKGPGWEPGKPWHGLLEDIPEVHAPVEKYDPQIPSWCKAYAIFHFMLVLGGYIEISNRHVEFSQTIVLGAILYLMLSLSCIGAILDGKSYAPFLEFSRCLLFFAVNYYLLPVVVQHQNPSLLYSVFINILPWAFVLSSILWTLLILRHISIHVYAKKEV